MINVYICEFACESHIAESDPWFVNPSCPPSTLKLIDSAQILSNNILYFSESVISIVEEKDGFIFFILILKYGCSHTLECLSFIFEFP